MDGVLAQGGGVRSWLLPLLDDAAEVGLRTGFLTEAGAELLLPGLKSVLSQISLESAARAAFL